jgi:hypothetical protein
VANRPSYILVDNQMMRVGEACREYNLEKHVFFKRLGMGWSVERALSHPVRKYHKRNGGKDADART